MTFGNHHNNRLGCLFSKVYQSRVVIFLGQSKFLEALEVTQKLLDDYTFMCESRVKPTYFSRKGHNKLTFKSTILFMLNLVRKSLQYELDHFFERFHEGDRVISKQGFSAARRKIKPEAFIKLHHSIVDWFYHQKDYKTFMGYRLCAIDASMLEINNSQRLRDAYNSAKGTSVELARAMTSCIYDIENNLIVKAKITKCTASERDIAKELIDMLKVSGLKNDLLLFDRGYPSIDFFHYLINTGVKFVIRMPKNRYQKRMDPSVSDQTIAFENKGQTMHLRVLKVALDSGVEEVLITNLMDDSMDIQSFKSLYFKRWGIETKFDELKNKLQLQKFTGDTPDTVEQDFYASMFLANMASLVKQEADEQIAKDHEQKHLKHEYTVNMNVLIGKLKDKLIEIILEKKRAKRVKIYQKLLVAIQRNKSPKRPGRQFIRRNSLKANKNGLNQRPCI